jgi:hypothetical protein
MKKVSTAAVTASRNISQQTLTVGLDWPDPVGAARADECERPASIPRCCIR